MDTLTPRYHTQQIASWLFVASRSDSRVHPHRSGTVGRSVATIGPEHMHSLSRLLSDFLLTVPPLVGVGCVGCLIDVIKSAAICATNVDRCSRTQNKHQNQQQQQQKKRCSSTSVIAQGVTPACWCTGARAQHAGPLIHLQPQRQPGGHDTRCKKCTDECACCVYLRMCVQRASGSCRLSFTGTAAPYATAGGGE